MPQKPQQPLLHTNGVTVEKATKSPIDPQQEELFNKVLIILRARKSINFTYYK